MRSEQLELSIEKEKYDYNLVLNNSFGVIFSTDDKKKMLKRIGEYPFGTGYMVFDRNNKIVEEFIPY